MTQDQVQPYRQAEQWIEARVKPGEPIVVDNVVWMDLVAHGYPMDTTVWFTKLDLDPSVAANFPDGWRDFEYVVSTPVLRATLSDYPSVAPSVADALSHSHLVAAFWESGFSTDGRGVEVREVDP